MDGARSNPKPIGIDAIAPASRTMALNLYNARFAASVGLGAAAIDALLRAGIDRPSDLASMPLADIERIHGIGPSALRKIKAYRSQAVPIGGPAIPPIPPTSRRST